MSLTKLIRAPVKLFKKDVITFLVIRRHDLGCPEDSMRYIAMKPSASISVLRNKVWHLLELPDYCEEVIVLKTMDGTEIPLTDLRKGNDPQHPYILEVWMPGNVRTNIISIGNVKSFVSSTETHCIENKAIHNACESSVDNINDSSKDINTMGLKTLKFSETKSFNVLKPDYKKSELSCRISSTSIFRLTGRKNRDSFTNVLLKIQSDLCRLTTKLSNLENRIPA